MGNYKPSTVVDHNLQTSAVLKTHLLSPAGRFENGRDGARASLTLFQQPLSGFTCVLPRGIFDTCKKVEFVGHSLGEQGVPNY
jgi:hypothetical protein